MAKEASKGDVEESNRMWASASFVGVLIIIGLPLWWKTTEVYRVSLPFEKINSFKPEAHRVATELVILAGDDATAAEVAGLVEKGFQDSDILKLKITHGVLSKELHDLLYSAADNQDAVDEASKALNLKQQNRFYLLQRKPLYLHVWLGAERLMFFRDSKAGPTIVDTLKHWVYNTAVLSGSVSTQADLARRIRCPPSAGYQLVLYTQQHVKQDVVEDYIGSFVDELSLLHNFTLRSQWLYQLNFDFQATEVKETSDWGRHFKVRSDRLHLLLTKLEERAAGHVSELPTINLVLYTVPCQVAPLAIYEGEERVSSPVQAFMSPKWGGVVFSNPSKASCVSGEESVLDINLAMGTFITQLRTLFGIVDTEPIEGASLHPLRSVHPREWEVDNLLRIRSLEQLVSAERTLQSLAQLLGEISNIVINDDVGASINAAVTSIARTDGLLASGDLVNAYKMSQQAFEAAETAFMDPSLLALLYFPDDQKYAIYIPLFLPIMFPVILSLKNLILWFRGKPVHKTKTD